MYVPVPVLVLLGIAFLVLALLAFRRRGGTRDLVAPPRAGDALVPTLAVPLPPWPRTAVPVGELTDEIDAQVRTLIAAGEKIEAIRLVRAATGLGLSEAKTLVERM
jgi:hypothetical protein